MKLFQFLLSSAAYGTGNPTVAPNAETLSSDSLPSGAVECPVQHPFAKFQQGTSIVDQCCKCQSQTKCKAASAGANYYNRDGALELMADDEEIDQSGVMCGTGCQENEECRYDKENCEYKCHDPDSSKIIIWVAIAAVAGTIIIGLLVFFCVRHCKIKVQIKNTIDVEELPDEEVHDEEANDEEGYEEEAHDEEAYEEEAYEEEAYEEEAYEEEAYEEEAYEEEEYDEEENDE